MEWHQWIQIGSAEEKLMENAGIDPATSRMLSERSTIWANSPLHDSYEKGGKRSPNIRT